MQSQTDGAAELETGRRFRACSEELCSSPLPVSFYVSILVYFSPPPPPPSSFSFFSFLFSPSVSFLFSPSVTFSSTCSFFVIFLTLQPHLSSTSFFKGLFLFFFLFYVPTHLPSCTYRTTCIHVPFSSSSHQSQKRASDPLELE